MRTLLIGAGLAALLSGAACAQDAPPPPPPPPGGPQAPGPHGPPPPPPPMTRDQVAAAVQRAFARIDANGDGVVTVKEQEAARKRMEEHRRERRDRAFDRLDADRNGAISRPEFDAPPPPPGAVAGQDGPPRHHGGMRGPGRGGPRPPLGGLMGPDWFAEADANHDGKVTLAEAQAAALARFDALDRNHDGTLSRDEMPAPPPPPASPRGDLPPPKRD